MTVPSIFWMKLEWSTQTSVWINFISKLSRNVSFVKCFGAIKNHLVCEIFARSIRSNLEIPIKSTRFEDSSQIGFKTSPIVILDKNYKKCGLWKIEFNIRSLASSPDFPQNWQFFTHSKIGRIGEIQKLKKIQQNPQ